jgi:hypothetical protein
LLKIPLPDVVAMQCRQPSLEGTGEIKLRRLVKEALRMRPSRIIVGEVRQEEASRLRIAIAQRAASAGEWGLVDLSLLRMAHLVIDDWAGHRASGCLVKQVVERLALSLIEGAEHLVLGR